MQAEGVLVGRPEYFNIQRRDQASQSVRVTNTQCVITVSRVLAPTAVVPLHKETLEGLGHPPFQILVNMTRLCTRCQLPEPPRGHSSVSEPTSTSVPSDLPLPPPVTRMAAQSTAAQRSDLGHGDGDGGTDDSESDDDSDDNPSSSESKDEDESDDSDEVKAEEMSRTQPSELETKLSDELFGSPCHQLTVGGEDGQDSKVKEDAFHVQDRVLREIPKKHSLRKPFAKALTDTMFAFDEKDKALVIAALASRTEN